MFVYCFSRHFSRLEDTRKGLDLDVFIENPISVGSHVEVANAGCKLQQSSLILPPKNGSPKRQITVHPGMLRMNVDEFRWYIIILLYSYWDIFEVSSCERFYLQFAIVFVIPTQPMKNICKWGILHCHEQRVQILFPGSSVVSLVFKARNPPAWQHLTAVTAQVAVYQIFYHCGYLLKPDVELSMRATLRAPVG